MLLFAAPFSPCYGLASVTLQGEKMAAAVPPNTTACTQAPRTRLLQARPLIPGRKLHEGYRHSYRELQDNLSLLARKHGDLTIRPSGVFRQQTGWWQKYSLLGEAGHGAFGDVTGTRIRDDGGRPVARAIKSMDSEDCIREIMNQFITQAGDGKNYVVPLIEAHVSERDGAQLVMERGGISLSRLFNRDSSGFAGVTAILAGVLQALAHCHERGVSHGDLHGGNILVSRDGDGILQVRLCDFGLSRLLDTGGEPAADDIQGIVRVLRPLLEAQQGYGRVGERDLLVEFLYNIPTLVSDPGQTLTGLQDHLQDIRRRGLALAMQAPPAQKPGQWVDPLAPFDSGDLPGFGRFV